MPKRSRSESDETVVVGKESWDELWAKSAPQTLPSQAELERQGWRTVSHISVMWRLAPNTVREKCLAMVQSGQFEQIKALVGTTRMPGVMYRPKPFQKASKR